MWYYNKSASTFEMVSIAGLFLIYTVFLFTTTLLSREGWDFIMSSSVLLNLFSNGSQLIRNCWNKSTGQLAFSTFFVAWIGVIARFFTVMVEASNDWVYLTNSIVGVVLNSLFVLQFAIYRNNIPDKEREEIVRQFDEETKYR